MATAANGPGATLGQRLYIARGRAKLSTKEAANGVGLRKDLIEAVEAEEPATEDETVADQGSDRRTRRLAPRQPSLTLGIVPTWRPVITATRAMPRRSLPRSLRSPIPFARRPPEEARTIAASTNTGTLATLTADGDPWASFVTYGLLGGAPVLCVSNLAEHGRNLAADPRASIAIVAPQREADPLASGRVTLAGVVAEPTGDERAAARDAHLSAVAAAKYYIDYSDFSLWVLRVQRVRWVGGYGRMDSATGEDYAAAEPDPVSPRSRRRDRPSQRRPRRRPRRDGAGARRLSRTPPLPPAPAPTGTDST